MCVILAGFTCLKLQHRTRLGWMMGSRVRPGFEPSRASSGNLCRIPPVVRGAANTWRGEPLPERQITAQTSISQPPTSTLDHNYTVRTATTERAASAAHTHTTFFFQQQPRKKKKKSGGLSRSTSTTRNINDRYLRRRRRTAKRATC